MTVPVTGPPALERVNVDVVIVDASIGSLNVAVIALLMATPVAPFAGLVDETVGGVVSACLVIEKVPVSPAQSPVVTE